MSFESVLQAIVADCPGALGAALMGSDGIAIAQVAAPGAFVSADEVSVLGVEFGRIFDEARKAGDAAGAGSALELSVRTERLHVVLQALDREIRVQRNPVGVDHVLEQRAVQHQPLLAKAVLGEPANNGLVGARRAGEDRQQHPLCSMRWRLPGRRSLNRPAQKALRGVVAQHVCSAIGERGSLGVRVIRHATERMSATGGRIGRWRYE